MLHINDDGEMDPSAKLVEINTIAASGFGCTQKIHKYVITLGWYVTISLN